MVPALRAFWDLEKTVLPEIRVSGINAKIPHLHIHKPKTVALETVLVIFLYVGGPPVWCYIEYLNKT